MKILIRRQEGTWTEPEVRGHRSEDDLQQLLATSPDLLPGDETGLPMAVARELHLGTGRVDLVGVDVEGQITLCECKLASNPGARREVVGQLLEYAGALRGMSYEEFSDRFQARTQSTLSEAAAGIAGESFDGEAFTAEVDRNLRAGRFRLVVVVDAITEALKQTILYLNDHLDGPLLALELAYLRDGSVEMLVPAVYGEESAEKKRLPSKTSVADADTVIVAARDAYKEYIETSAYICQPFRSFRDEVRYLGFYKDKAIQREVPLVRHRRKNVLFSPGEAERLQRSGDSFDKEIGLLVQEFLGAVRREMGSRHQVFLLSSPEDHAATIVLPSAVSHAGPGAWTQAQRYTSSEALRRRPATTEELTAEGG